MEATVTLKGLELGLARAHVTEAGLEEVSVQSAFRAR